MSAPSRRRRPPRPGAARAAALLVPAALLLAVAASGCGGGHAGDRTDPARVEEETRLVVEQLAGARAQIARNRRRLAALRPAGTYIVVDSFANRIRLMDGGRVLIEDRCSTGSGSSLTDPATGRTWTFRTPRGRRSVTSNAVNDPVWIRPDWAFVESGVPPPEDPRLRAENDVLGEYALPIGDGYFIHGTLYTRLLGYPVTHGCIRVGDSTLEEIVAHARPGTPVFIY